MIPQSFTDRIIEQINLRKNIDLGAGMSITSDIHIANWHLGFENAAETEKFVLWTKEKEGFIRLINLIVSWETEGENALVSEPASFVSQKQIVDPRTMINRLNEWDTAIIGAWWGLDMWQVYQNLGWNA